MRFLDERIWDAIQADDGQSNNLPLTMDSLKEHEAILDAIVKRESHAARQAVHLHFINSAKRRGIALNTSSMKGEAQKAEKIDN